MDKIIEELLNTITVCRQGGVYGFEIKSLELYSFESKVSEAAEELQNEMITLKNDLNEIDDKYLGKYPKKWKRILNGNDK